MGKDAVEAGQIDPGPWHQCGQAGSLVGRVYDLQKLTSIYQNILERIATDRDWDVA
ncbi:MAG: hypothetical protein KJO35_09480 [Gammaproteobacteria bacterium]|nr:hypothetical protein [Gammaproteobacteria bacterium]